MKSKGITDIIAIVLLLMITISMVGFAWLWLQRMTAGSLNKSSENIEQFSSTAGQVAVIDAIDKTNNVVYLRNAGSQAIAFANVKMYLNGAAFGCNTAAPYTWTSISVGGTVPCQNATVGIGTCVTSIKVTSPGGEDNKQC